jgi:ABC-type Zn uptake system ZnuABC Zn-binding protein ZnuA
MTGIRTRALIAVLAGLGAVAALLGGCGAGTGASRPGTLAVTATTTQVADLVRAVGGPSVDVHQILQPNSDPHEYEVRPGDVRAIAESKLVIASGGDVDAWLGEATDAAGAAARVTTLIDHVRTQTGSEAGQRGDTDPHWWQDPRNGVRAVAAIRDALTAADPRHAPGFRRRATAYTRRVERLDRAIASCWKRVAPAQRRLVTTHDALGYYAHRYGIQVIGAVIPSLSTAGAPSAGGLARLVAAIRYAHVKAIFAERSVNAKVEQAIASETGAVVGRPLWADSLGPAGSDGATYLASLASNTRALVGGLTGGAVACRLP